MKKLQNQLKAVAEELSRLSRQVDKLATQVAKQAKTKPAPKKKVAKKVAAKKTTTKKSVLDSVYDVVRRSRKGATIAQLKKKTGLNPRQLSNALYKLTSRGKIVSKSRGVYTTNGVGGGGG
jgi:DNA replicative helicase MCM subunit Mcm2 (Cdc46/Mcm family)